MFKGLVLCRVHWRYFEIIKLTVASRTLCIEFFDLPNLLIHRILGWVLPEAGQDEGKQSTLILSRLMVEFNRQYAHYYNKKENSEDSLSKMKDQIRKEFGTMDLKKIAEQLETP